MGASHDIEFEKLIEGFNRFILKNNPVLATFLGEHEFDHDFTDYSPSALKKREEKLTTYRKNFKAINKRLLDVENRVDLEIALGKIETEYMFLCKFALHELNPNQYLHEILYGTYLLVVRESASIRERQIAITRRLVQVSNMLKNARKHLKSPPRVFVESAIQTCSGAVNFFKTVVPEFAQNTRGALYEALMEANEETIDELEKFGEYLEKKLLPKCKKHFAFGKTNYNFLLKQQHKLSHSSDKLVSLAKKEIKAIEADLKKQAKLIDKKSSWQQVVEELKNNHPSGQALIGAYKKEMQRARDFVAENDLVTFPEGESIDVVETPAFARALIPYAAYVAPAPLETNQLGVFWVTVSESGEGLKDHAKDGLAVTALHEAYPGHHLQLTKANRNKRLIRHLADTSVFAEGWAFYCEEMMYEQKFYEDPKQRLLQLKDALWRAYRVIIDVGLHSKTISFEDAVDLLVKKVGIEEANAYTEVMRYCQSPTQPMSYYIGKLEIMDLLADYQKKHKKDFELKKFHDDLLSHGTIPVSCVRTLMGL